MIRIPMVVLSCLGVIALIGVVRAQEPASDAGQLPAKPFTAIFAKVTSADSSAGTLEYLVTKPVYETVQKEAIETVKLPDGKVGTRTKTYTVSVCKCVCETRAMKVDGVQLTNTAGKSMPLIEAMKRVDLKGRDVLFAMDGSGIDPYYLKFLAKDVLIIVPVTSLAPSSLPMPIPTTIPPDTVPVPAAPAPAPIPVPLPLPLPAP